MTVIAFDRRATHFVESKVRALDALDDIDALAAETRGHLVASHSAHVQDDWARYLTAVERANRRLLEIRRIARARKGEIESATAMSPDQIAIWTRTDGAVIAPDGAAA